MNKADIIAERLKALRQLMQRESLSAFIIPSTDPHNGEYVPEHWEARKWISGFTGSAGTAVVTMNSAALWTDSRYFIAAAEELRGTEFHLMKERIAGTPSISEWIAEEMVKADGGRFNSRGHDIGIDGMTSSNAYVEQLIMDMRRNGGITVRTNLDPFKTIWTDRPDIPLNKVEIQPLQYTGRSAHEKIEDIRKALRKEHADGMLTASLEDIAWTLNLRGSDVHCNPVFVSYMLIDQSHTTLFIDQCKLTAETKQYLRSEGIDTKEYTDIRDGLRHYMEYNILMDPNEINHTLYQIPQCKQKISASSPIPSLKSIKTKEEIRGFRNAMTRDGVALVKFLHYLHTEFIDKEAGTLTEIDVVNKIHEYRKEQELFRGDSFDTIAAYGEHGAIVHYEPTVETSIPLQHHGFILIDTGAQYQDGTTDITRTIPLGPLTDKERLVYTLVLKGHIQLEMLHFPDGASGTQLDAVARKDMWSHGYNFLHGTGHGVGSYLGVHEGPHQIRMEYRPAPLHAGMTITDEPGIYVEGEFGVRIENTLIIEESQQTAFGKFLRFSSLTLCPIDTEPIILDMLSYEERQWLNNYHKHVYDTLAPFLNSQEREWLKNTCKNI